MNSNQNKLFAAAVLASALVGAGCSADMFNQANTALKTIQTAGNAVGNVRIPTAAVAASLGGLELVKALSSDGAEKKSGIIAAGGGNLVAAGSGNIIAAGGLNFSVLQAGSAALSGKVVKKINANGVEADLEYTTTIKGRQLISSIDKFNGKTNGYLIDLSGAEFVYNIDEANGGDVDFTFTKGASLTKPATKEGGKAFETKLTQLNFSTKDPMPKNYAYIGGFTLDTTDDGFRVVMNADLGIEDSKVVVNATILTTDLAAKAEWEKTHKEDEPYLPKKKEIRFGQDNPSFTDEELTEAQKKAREEDAKKREAARKDADAHRACRNEFRANGKYSESCQTLLRVDETGKPVGGIVVNDNL